MKAVRNHTDAVALRREKGEQIPHLMDLLAKLKAARCAYFEEYLKANRCEKEMWRNRFLSPLLPSVCSEVR